MIELPLNQVLPIKMLVAGMDTGEAEDPLTPTYKFFGPGNAVGFGGGALADHTASGEEGFVWADVTLSAAAGFVVGSIYTLVCYASVGGTNVRLKELEFRIVAAERTAGLREVNVTRKNNAVLNGTGVPSDKWRG